MDLKRFVEKLGNLHAGFNILEGDIRGYLYFNALKEEPPPLGLDHYRINDPIEISPLTEKLTFGGLLRKYNAVADPQMTFSNELTDIRNVLAHGLLISDQTRGGAYRLINFRRNPKDKTTMIVSFTLDITDAWINHTQYLTINAHDHVTKALQNLRAKRREEL